jgi:hypothetical protein
MDTGWHLPPMVHAWGAQAGSLEVIRFAAANRLCIQIDYTKENGERSAPTIEPYSVRRTSAGDLLLFGVKADTGESRSYRLDRIRSATVTRQPFQARYTVELTSSGPLVTPPIERSRGGTTVDGLGLPFAAHKSARPRKAKPAGPFGVKYNFECSLCGKRFTRTTYDATLNPHKNKQGWPCPGRVGFLK